MTQLSFSARWLGVAAVALALPLAAAAQEAYTRGSPTLFAGPSPEYPAVARLAPGQPLNVVGCTDGYGWCDVVLPDGLRGWVAANRLEYDYDGDTVPLASYGAAIGVPIVGFTLGNYWNNYYRDRPWYREPRWWGNRPPPPPMPGWRPPPPPAMGWSPRPPGPGWNAPPPRPEWNGRPPAAPMQPPPVAMPRPQPQPQFPMQPPPQRPPMAGPQPQPSMPVQAAPQPRFPMGPMPRPRGGAPFDGSNADRP